MKKILLSLAAVSALAAAAAPAAAQPYRGQAHLDRHDVSRGDVLELRIERLFERRQISGREARALRADVRDAKRLEWRYARDGHLSNWERADLDRRFDRIQADIRHERRDRNYGFLR